MFSLVVKAKVLYPQDTGAASLPSPTAGLALLCVLGEWGLLLSHPLEETLLSWILGKAFKSVSLSHLAWVGSGNTIVLNKEMKLSQPWEAEGDSHTVLLETHTLRALLFRTYVQSYHRDLTPAALELALDKGPSVRL